VPIDLTLHQMRVLERVARVGGISRAAISLGLPQPAVSRIIARIEEIAGVPLFIRTGGGAIPSDAGSRFLVHVTEAIRRHDLALAEAAASAGRVVGEARLAAPESIGDMIFAPLVTAFKSAHPDAAVRVFAARSSTIPGLLEDGVADIGVVADTHAKAPGPTDFLFREVFYLIGRVGMPGLDRYEIPLVDCAALPLILNALPGGFRQPIDSGFARVGASPTVVGEIDANAPLLDLLRAGQGYSILPYALIAPKGRAEGLAVSRIVAPEIDRALRVATPAGRPLSPVAREAVAFLRRAVADHATAARWLPA
jgi:DNA-binding transcriptional LysR family regulator